MPRTDTPAGWFSWLRGENMGARLLRLTVAMVVITLGLLPWADLSITTHDPWHELGRMLKGMLLPDVTATESPLRALLLTVTFALWGVALGMVLGFPLALIFMRSRLVRTLCAFVRAIHELFWALLFLQVFGLSAITALAAIALPYAATFAKVYAEILAQIDRRPAHMLSPHTDRLSRFIYTELPLAWQRLSGYTRYRFECALRASVLLGFVGLPTLGYYLESAFRQGRYHEGGALLWAFYLLIALLPWWAHRRLLLPWMLGTAFLLGPWPSVNPTLLWQFLNHDIWPQPLLSGDIAALPGWFAHLPNLLPAIGNTLLLGLMSTVGSLMVALLAWPLVSRHFGNRATRAMGRGTLIIMRSTPELLLAFILLLLTGPSLLPAWIALSLHNGALIAFLAARHADETRPGLPGIRGINLYSHELLPRVYPGILALLFYRAEVIMRETALLGMLGVVTLGFHIDSSFEYLMFDQAVALLMVTAVINMGVDVLSRRLRPDALPEPQRQPRPAPVGDSV
ncbi:phosphonate ABC transporter, permease protein PhnE [Kushneria pakistanensis]|uniref:Phosphonate ABC transporter, permease protein PhnE n=1 Tax=Kushneria pakistanensis TaxID=1508770 RepID=A0ABQ3FLJ2_9GAMM|nr:ABC transporter permease [Kushneria pakistanensis]GHC29356.1 phosphonate ABC transporter, permease protein PhnE [Kushneria pakistanensis]